MADQTKKGKAFEYACLKALLDSLIENQEIVVEDTCALVTAKGFYDAQDILTAI